MPELGFSKTHRKQILWNLRLSQAGTHEKNAQN